MAPLTLLVGPNGSGKSNVIRSIFLASLVSRDVLSAKQGDIPEDQTVRRYRPPPIQPVEVYAFTRYPLVLVRLSLGTFPRADFASRDLGTVKLDWSPERKRPYVGLTSSPTRKGGARSLVETVARIRFISTDRLIRPDIDTQSMEVEEQDLLVGKQLVLALKQIGRNGSKSDELVKMGRELFGVDWSRLIEDPEDMHFVDAAIGPRGVRLPFHLASLGTRQFFPILVHSLASDKDRILLTEEPEISLHPLAQVAAGEYLARAASRGVQLVVSTHSHYLLLGICKQVRAGLIPPGQVAVLNCEKTRYGTKVNRLPMDNSGRIDGWIPSFSEVDDYLFEDWVRSIGEAGG